MSIPATDKYGILLRRLRKKANITQSQIVDRLSVSLSTYKLWEQGKSTPDLSQWDQIASVLSDYGISFDLEGVITQALDGKTPSTHPEKHPLLENDIDAPIPMVPLERYMLPPYLYFAQFTSYNIEADWSLVSDAKRNILKQLYDDCAAKIKSLKSYYEGEFHKVLNHPNYTPVDKPPF